jgi:hypothetical protein
MPQTEIALEAAKTTTDDGLCDNRVADRKLS